MSLSDPADPQHVFLAGTVISQSTSSFKIRDSGNRIALAWSHIGTPDPSDLWKRSVDRGSAALFSLKQGFQDGVIENVFDSYWPQPGPWYGQPCTYIQVNDAPFEASLVTSTLGNRYLRFYDDVTDPQNPQWVSETIIGVDGWDFTLTGNRQIVILNHHDAQIDVGDWYYVQGSHHFNEAPRTGRWGNDAYATMDGTWFGAEEFAREFWFQQGWMLQPDIDAQVFLPITAVSGNWVKVNGSYAALGAKGHALQDSRAARHRNLQHGCGPALALARGFIEPLPVRGL